MTNIIIIILIIILFSQGNEYCTKANDLIGEDTIEEADAVREFKKICETWVFTPAISVRRSRKVMSKQAARSNSTSAQE